MASTSQSSQTASVENLEELAVQPGNPEDESMDADYLQSPSRQKSDIITLTLPRKDIHFAMSG